MHKYSAPPYTYKLTCEGFYKKGLSRWTEEEMIMMRQQFTAKYNSTTTTAADGNGNPLSDWQLLWSFLQEPMWLNEEDGRAALRTRFFVLLLFKSYAVDPVGGYNNLTMSMVGLLGEMLSQPSMLCHAPHPVLISVYLYIFVLYPSGKLYPHVPAQPCAINRRINNNSTIINNPYRLGQDSSANNNTCRVSDNVVQIHSSLSPG